MDAHLFDDLTRSLAASTTRRRAIRTIAAIAGSGLLARLGQRYADAAAKVAICHRTGDPANPFVYQKVDASAVPTHEAHGDAIAPDFQTNPAHCGGCGIACAADEACVDGGCRADLCGTCAPGELCVDGACECWTCPGGQGCLDGACTCSSIGACPDGDTPRECGLMTSDVEFACQAGCCCVSTGTPSWAYQCLQGGDPYCCSAYCGPEGTCACIPDGHVDNVWPCLPGPFEHCCSGWCGPDGRCAPVPS